MVLTFGQLVLDLVVLTNLIKNLHFVNVSKFSFKGSYNDWLSERHFQNMSLCVIFMFLLISEGCSNVELGNKVFQRKYINTPSSSF